MTIAQELAEWSVALSPADVAPVRHSLGRHLLDGVGVAMAARRGHHADPAVTVATNLGGPPEARILGGRQFIGAVPAAFGSGALVHALDFDDTHGGGLVHATAVVLPTVLSVGQQVGATGEQVLAAAAVGYEFICRIAAGSPHGFHARGLHATSVVGPLAAAAITAKLTGLDVDGTVHAIGIAGSSAAGLLEFLVTGSSTKQFHPGSAAAAGIVAARLAAAGGTGPSSVIEGRYGIYASLSARPFDPGPVTRELGTRWECTQLTIKPYPACQLLHATLDALRTLEISAEDVAGVVVEVHPDAIDVVCEPREAKILPRTPYEAKFSLPWSAAALLLDGQIDIDSYTQQSIERPAVVELASRIQVAVMTSADDAAGLPAADAPGRVCVTTRRGAVRHAAVPSSTGGPNRPMSDADLSAKFAHNLGGDGTWSSQVEQLILGLGSAPDLNELFDALEKSE